MPRILVNGRPVGGHLGPSAKGVMACVDVSEFPRPGRNCAAVEGVNTGVNSAANNKAYLFARLVAAAPGGPQVLTATDSSWKLNTVARPGWQSPDFDDQNWSRALKLLPFAASALRRGRTSCGGKSPAGSGFPRSTYNRATSGRIIAIHRPSGRRCRPSG